MPLIIRKILNLAMGTPAGSNFIYQGSGTIIIGSETTYGQPGEFLYQGSGTIIIGSETTYSQGTAYQGSGVINIGSETEYSAEFDITLDKEFSWDYSLCIPRWFRVEGDCFVPNHGNSSCATDCPRQFFTNVLACNVEEVCQKLRDRGFVYPITSIKRFPGFASRRRNEEFNISMDDPTCLTDVTPTIAEINANCLECCDFFIDSDIRMDVGVIALAQESFIYQGSGVITISSEPTKDFLCVGSGSIIVDGETDYTAGYIFAGEGVITVEPDSGEIVSSNWEYEGSGSIIVDGELTNIVATSWEYSGDGTIIVSGGAGLGFEAIAEGDVLIGSEFNCAFGLIYEGSGSIIVDGEFGVISEHYSHVMDGSIIIGSETTYESSDLGTLETLSGIFGEVSDEGAIFTATPAPLNTTIVPNISVTTCCPATMTPTLELRHNLQNLTDLIRFINQNGFILPGQLVRGTSSDFIKLSFNPRLGSWNGNLHYLGKSPITNSNQIWDLAFEFACVSEMALSDLSESAWKFSMMVTVKNVGVSDSDSVSRLLVAFSPGIVCQTQAPFNRFRFTYDVRRDVIQPSSVQNVVFHDDDLLFKKSFVKNPILEINISSNLNNKRRTFGHLIPLEEKSTV